MKKRYRSVIDKILAVNFQLPSTVDEETGKIVCVPPWEIANNNNNNTAPQPPAIEHRSPSAAAYSSVVTADTPPLPPPRAAANSSPDSASLSPTCIDDALMVICVNDFPCKPRPLRTQQQRATKKRISHLHHAGVRSVKQSEPTKDNRISNPRIQLLRS